MQQPALNEDDRHNQLFKILRQTNQAETTVMGKRGYQIRKVSEEEMRMLQAAAVRSLQASH